MDAVLNRLELDIEITVIEQHVKRLKKRSVLRAAYLKQLKEAKLKRLKADTNYEPRKAA